MLFINSPMSLPIASKVMLYGAGGRGEKFLSLLQKHRPDVVVLGFLDTFTSGTLGAYPVTLFSTYRHEPNVHIVVCSVRADAISNSLERAGIKKFYIYIDFKSVKAGVLDITTNCNAKCIFCPEINNDARIRGQDWDIARFNKALSCLADVDEICFCCSCGEPILNKFLGDMLKECKILNKKTSFYTNGSALVDSIQIRAILEYADKIFLSFVSPRPEIQDHFMKQVKVEEVKANLRRIARHPTPPKLVMNVLVMRENIAHLREIVDFASQAGVAQVVFTRMRREGLSSLEHCVLGSPSPEEKKLWGEEVTRVKEHGSSGPVEIHVSADLEELAQESPGSGGAPACAAGEGSDLTRLCLLPWTQSTIYYDGTTSPCCTTRHSFGNAFTSQEPLFEGTKHKYLRQTLLSGSLYGPCRTCKIAPLDKRSALAQLLGHRGFLVPGLNAPITPEETFPPDPVA
ncbi:MAG: radical SAM protein [Erysipelotrichales bacterium]|nr:radical SAM protein [Erysipelotrichales bacterium]